MDEEGEGAEETFCKREGIDKEEGGAEETPSEFFFNLDLPLDTRFPPLVGFNSVLFRLDDPGSALVVSVFLRLCLADQLYDPFSPKVIRSHLSLDGEPQTGTLSRPVR